MSETEFLVKLGITALVSAGIFAWMMWISKQERIKAKKKFEEKMRILSERGKRQ